MVRTSGEPAGSRSRASSAVRGGRLSPAGSGRRPAASAVEEPALEEWENLLPREGPSVGEETVALQDAHVVLERFVRALERVVELVTLEDDVLCTRLVGLAEVRVYRPADDPDGAGSSVDPEHDPLLVAKIVHACERSLGVPAFTGAPSHVPGIQSRLVSGFKNLFSFLFQRNSAEEHVARYVIREHDRGRSLAEILEDRYVQNRLTPEQQKRLLDRPEIVGAISGDVLDSVKTSIEPS